MLFQVDLSAQQGFWCNAPVIKDSHNSQGDFPPGCQVRGDKKGFISLGTPIVGEQSMI